MAKFRRVSSSDDLMWMLANPALSQSRIDSSSDRTRRVGPQKRKAPAGRGFCLHGAQPIRC
jgi:hypothetical protein